MLIESHKGYRDNREFHCHSLKLSDEYCRSYLEHGRPMKSGHMYAITLSS